MKYKRCVIVLIGSETDGRYWVEHEIKKAWNDGKALLGVYIHNLRCPMARLEKAKIRLIMGQSFQQQFHVMTQTL